MNNVNDAKEKVVDLLEFHNEQIDVLGKEIEDMQKKVNDLIYLRAMHITSVSKLTTIKDILVKAEKEK